MAPFVEQRGKSFLRYSEESQVSKTKVDVPMIEKHVQIVAAIREKDHNLSFRCSFVKESFDLLVGKHGDAWNLAPEHQEDWAETMTRRLRNLLFAVKHSECKRVQPEWVKRVLPWHQDGAGAAHVPAAASSVRSSGTDSASASSAGTAAAYEYGWNK